MIKKISISNVEWERSYCWDVDKTVRKLCKCTLAYGTPMLVMGVSFGLFGLLKEPEYIQAYLSLDGAEAVVQNSALEKLGGQLSEFIRQHMESKAVIESYKSQAAESIVSVFKQLR